MSFFFIFKASSKVLFVSFEFLQSFGCNLWLTFKTHPPIKTDPCVVVNIESTLLLNYFNELFGSGTDIFINDVAVKEFTKFNLSENLIIKNIFRSGYSNINIILTNNGLYAYKAKNKIFKKLGMIDCTNWEYNTININNSFGWEGVNIFQTNYKINRKQKKERIYNIYKQLLDVNNSFFDAEFHY